MDIPWTLPMPPQKNESGQDLNASLALRDGDRLTALVLDVQKDNDALLAIGQFKAYARLPLPVVTGQDFQIRVESAGEGLRMVMEPKNDPVANLPTNGRLEIRLFEVVSDRPLLAAHSQSLVAGESLRGRITGFEKDGLMLVDFGEFKAFAKIDIPVRQGQIIPLTVLQTDGGLTLAVSSPAGPGGSRRLSPPDAASSSPRDPTSMAQQALPASPANHPPAATAPLPNPASTVAAVARSMPPTTADMAILRDHIQQILVLHNQSEKDPSLPLSLPMKGALINLQQALNPATPAGDMTTLMARVRAFVENSGLYFEKRLEQAITSLQTRSTEMTSAELARQPAIRDLMVNDLKPNLLIIKHVLNRQLLDSPGVDRHLLETLKSVVQRTVAHIEQQQIMATEKPVDPDLSQAFSHMLFLTDTHRNARLKVYYAKKGRDDAHKNPRVSLLLDMDRMGTVRADLWMVGKDLNVTFFVREAAVKAAIENEQHRIGEVLNDTFSTVAVSVVVNEKKITEFEGEDLTIPKRRQVDLSI